MCMATDSVSYGGSAEEQQIDLSGSGRSIPTFAYGYAVQDRRPAVVILHDVFGPKPLYRDLGKRLADEGFAALLPDLFVREGPPENDSREAVFARAGRHSFPTAMEDIRTIVEHLANEGRAVTVIGFCMGGTLALFAAARIPALAGCVVFYGFPVNASPAPNRPDSPIDEVAHLQVPLLGFFGEEDTGVGPDNVRRYERAAVEAGKHVDFTIYPNAGHSFLTFDPAAPTAGPSQDSWQRTIAFLRERLGAPVEG
jgi:carboxymethylenebutenolidase